MINFVKGNFEVSFESFKHFIKLFLEFWLKFTVNTLFSHSSFVL